MEVEVDLASIRDEELLRRMWQQSEDFGRKKDIRQHLYKLREARLREFYTIGTEIMDCPPGQGIITKSPLTPSHGDSLADQSFQSFKSKEIRDSESPTKDMKFAQQQLHNVRDGSVCVKPDTSGWNVVTSSETNPDGTGFKTETLATTGGVRKIAGGQSEFAGKNEHMQKGSHHGDDKNFVKTAAESSNTKLQESSIVGDENSGRIEKKTSTTVSSSSQSYVSKSTTGNDGGFDDNFSEFPSNALLNRRDSTQSNMSTNSNMSNQQHRQLTLQEKLQQSRKNVESRSTTSVREEEHQHQQHQNHREQRQYQDEIEKQQYRNQQKQQQDERIIREQQHHQQQQTQQKSTVSKNAERFMTQYKDQDGVTYTKSPVINQDSPAELQQEFKRLEMQPGKIISRTIEYPKPNVKMIVEKKELADGTIVTSRNYETEGTPTVTETKKLVSGSRQVEKGGTYKISITKGNTDDDQHQFTKNVDQRSRQILRDTDQKLTNTNERNITNRTINSNDRQNIEREYQQTHTNVNEDISRQDIMNEARRVARDHEEKNKRFNRIDTNEEQDWTNRDTVDRSTVSNIQRNARDHVENLKNQVETFEVHKTVKKDLSQTMRKENISSQDFRETESGCVFVDRDNLRGKPEKITAQPNKQFDDCYDNNETNLSKKSTYNRSVYERENDYNSNDQTPRQIVPQEREPNFTTHGFPSQRSDYDSNDTFTTTEHYENRTERIKKSEDFSTHGFPSARDPSPKKTHDYSPTHPNSKSKDNTPDFTTHGFPSARVPNEKKVVDHGPIKHHEKRPEQDFDTHGFPSVRDPTPKVPVDHGPVKSPKSKQPNQDFSTHGFPSNRTPNEKRPQENTYSPHNETPGTDFTTKSGFPNMRTPIDSKQTKETNIEVKRSNQYQTNAKQNTTEKKTEMYTSTDSLRREKKTDAAHDAFARSLRCASPVDTPRRDSNASQKSTSYRTHSIQTSRGSTPTYRAPTATSKLKTREVHHSNETIDLGSPHHHVDDLKRRGTSKVTTATTTTTTRNRDNSGEIQKKNVSQLNKQNKPVVHEPKITKKTIIEDDRFIGAEEIVEQPIVKKEYKQLCPDSCPLPDRFAEINEITKNISPENYGAKRTIKNRSQNFMEPTESQINRVSKHFEEHPKVNPKAHEQISRPKQPLISNIEANIIQDITIDRNKSPIQHNISTEKSTTKRHYLEPTESQISRVSKNVENYLDADQSIQNLRASSPIRKSSPVRETSPNRKISPTRTQTNSNKSIEKIQSSEEHNIQHKNYSKPHTIHGPVPINPEGYVSKKVSSEISKNIDFKEIDDSKVTYPGFLKKSKSKSKSPKGSPTVSPDRASPNRNASPNRIKQRDDLPSSNKKPGPLSDKEPYYVPQYDSPRTKQTSTPRESLRTTNQTKNALTTKTIQTKKFDRTVDREDITYDIEDNTERFGFRSPQDSGKSPVRYPQSSSPERTTHTKQDSTSKTFKTSKYDSTVTHDVEDHTPLQPQYTSSKKPTTRYSQSPSPERTTFKKDRTTKTIKTNTYDVNRKITQEDGTSDMDDNTEPYNPRESRSQPITTRRQSPEKISITKDDILTKETQYNFGNNTEPLSPQHPHSAQKEKPNSKYSPERPNVIQDNFKTTTSETNKCYTSDIREETLYDENIAPLGPRQPKSNTTELKPITKHPQSTSPLRNTTAPLRSTTSPNRSTTTQSNNQKLNPESPQSRSPDRFTNTKRITTTTITTKTHPELYTTGTDGIETESPRSGSPTSDFEYRRNTDVKQQTLIDETFTHDMTTNYVKNIDDTINTEFITKEKENVYRDKSPVHDKYRPRSTLEYFEETDKISNLRQYSEDDKPKEPFFLKQSPQSEVDYQNAPVESEKPKTKVPFNRRETFEERCRQVLGIDEIDETNEFNETTSIITEHNTTSDFINNEKNLEENRKVRKSSSPSPVPSPRSSSPKKIPNQEYVKKTDNEYKSTRHDDDSLSIKKSETTHPNRPNKSPIRKTSPQQVKPNESTKDTSYVTTTTKTIRKNIDSSSPRGTPNNSTYSRSPVSSPERRPLNKLNSPGPTPNSFTRTSHNTIAGEEITDDHTHISVAKIKISPETTKTTKTKTTTTKITSDSRKPSNKNVPLIHKRIDSGPEDESDIISDNEDVITTTTTKITKTMTKKGSPIKKLPVTERKESAPVYRSTQVDREQKMTRSTSDNVLKTQKGTKLLDSEKLAPTGVKSPRKNSSDNKKDLKTEKRPIKCLTTKTINLSTKSNIINSEDMENVIIDIQQAKSSREPSPNKMVPIPVPFNEDTGKPRYPDKVQEPDDIRRGSKIKNIPIYEESKHDFIGCQITEIAETEEEVVKNKNIRNKNYIHENQIIDEDCLLSVHDKVTKFISTAEEVKRPKSSAPFQRDVPHMNFPEDDDCLLSVNDKVNKFLTTAEKVTKDVITSTGKRIERVSLDEIDKNLREDECIMSVSQKVNKFINTAEKLIESQPQKSPELVKKIEKQISRQSDDNRDEDEPVDIPQNKIKTRITERYTPDKSKKEPLKTNKPLLKSTDAVRKAKSVFEKNELKDVKLTKTTVNTKQRDILSRPSIWESKKQETIEERKNLRNRDTTERFKPTRTTKPVSIIRDLETTPFDNYDKTVITSKTELSAKAEDITSRLTRKTSPRRPSDSPSTQYPGKKTIVTKTEYTDEYSNKFGRSSPKNYSPNRSPVRDSLTPKQPLQSKTEYTDKYTDKHDYTEKHISKKISSSSITSKKYDQKNPTELLNSPSNQKPDTYSPSWSKHKQPKEGAPTRKDSPNRLPSSYIQENTTTSTSTTRTDYSPTRPSTKSTPSQRHMYPDDNTLHRAPNQYTEESKPYRTSTLQSGTPSPSVLDRKYLFENVEPNAPRPSYMDHTKASLEHIRRDSLEINRTSYNRKVSVDEESFDGNPQSSVKFGVDLKHHNESKPRRKSSSPDIPHVEEIFDLNLLEQMLSVVVGYEQRRRIRSQIRIVKKMIEQKNKEDAQIAYIRETSPARRSGSSEREHSISSITRENIRNKTDDEQIAYIRETSPARRSSPTRSITSTSSHKKNTRTKSSSSFIEKESKHIEKQTGIRDRSPQSKTKTITTVTEIKKFNEKPINKTKPVLGKDSKTDDKPIWATKNILKKPSETNHSSKSNTTKKTYSSTTKTTQSQKQKVSSDEDCITSSYGIGPTDEDGRPLFGIRALKKKQQPSETNQVTGTVITEKYYSENGSAPVGKRTITVYSTNPNDIDEYESKYDHTKRSGSIKRESAKQNGMTSVTRTQKIGDDYLTDENDYPALTDDLSTTNSKSSKVIRKGSVKEMSEKFIRKESSSSVTEKTTSTSSTSYPKAGLILRTKTTNRESTPTGRQNYGEEDGNDYDYEYDSPTRHSQHINESESENESCHITKTVNKSSKSFLNTTGSKVTGVDDVLERMRNADNVVEDGDTMEDQEARALLNKFLGASVLMSGVETMVPNEVITTKTTRIDGSGPECTQKVKTTRVTKTTKTEGSSSSPVAQQSCDIEEIWDIEFLKELLEQSTSYEERSKIRARIKQLMAEREACAEIVASVKAELQSTNAKKQSPKVETTVKKVVTTSIKDEEEVSDNGEEGEEEEEEVDDSSSEYEEIIEEVTDSEDDEVEETTTVVKTTQLEPSDKKSIVKTTVVEKTVVEQAKQIPTDSKQIKTTTIKTENLNKDKKEGKNNNNNINEDISEGDLLPLLQGLLHKNMPPITHNQTPKPKATNNTNNNSCNYSSNNQKNNIYKNNIGDSNKIVSNAKKTPQITNTQLNQKYETNTNRNISSIVNKKINSGHHPIEDSGTESGEDLRLIAAGLRDTMQMHSIKDPNDSGLISDVTTALNRLEQSLKEGKHIKLESSKRNALLNLVGRLQTGLISPDKIPPPTPVPDQTGEMETSSPEADIQRGSNRQRFAKRRSRANRHTVGVSREELADARRYMEEMVMIENMSNCTTPESSAVTPSDLTPQVVKNEQTNETKTADEKKIQQQSQKSVLYRPNQFVPNNLRETIASQEEHIPENPKSAVQMRPKKPQYEPNQRLSGNFDQQVSTAASRRPLSDSYSSAFSQQIENPIYQNASQPYFNENSNTAHVQYNGHVNQPTYESTTYVSQQTTNPMQYAINTSDQSYDGIYDSVSPSNVPLNRFSNKKLAMKRANTIDIPKPMKYIHDMESDSDAEERGVCSTKSIGLRGTVQVSVKTKPRHVVPAFQPKTENDIKFLQFIQKQGPSPSVGWANPNRTVSNWTNKFGNIINCFESGSIGMTSKPPVPASAAKNFWKKNDVQSNTGGKQSFNKVSKSAGRPPWADQNYSSNVLTSALKTKERNEFSNSAQNHNSSANHQYSHQQQQFNNISQTQDSMQQQQHVIRQQQSPVQKQYIQSPQQNRPQQQIIKPKPIALNNFSHAPQSVFRPVDPISPEYSESFKPIHNDPRLHQSEPHLNYQYDGQFHQDQVMHQEHVNKPWSLVGKYSAPSSPHHSIPSPTKSWVTNKNSTPSSPVTSTLPWLSKNKVENRIRTKAERFDKKSPPPAHLQRHHSLRGTDQAHQNRMSTYDLDKVDLKRPSLPNAGEPFVNGVYQSQPVYASNPKINYGQSQEPQYQATIYQRQESMQGIPQQQRIAMPQQPTPYQTIPPYYNSAPNINQASVKSDYNIAPYQPPLIQYKPIENQTYQSVPYRSNDNSEPTISTFSQPRHREESLTNPNAEPLILTNAKPIYGPTQPLKIFDYPSPSCSISSPNFTQNDATDDDLDPECLTEYKAETRVMTGPISQQAITVGNKTRHIGADEKNNADAKNLLSVMKNLGNSSYTKDNKPTKGGLSPDGRSYQAPHVKSVFPETEINDQNRMPTYLDSNQPEQPPRNDQNRFTHHNETSRPTIINKSDPSTFIQTQYQQNPTYVPPVQETKIPTMYTGYPPGYQLPPETNTEFDFKSRQPYQQMAEQIQVKANSSYKPPAMQTKSYQPVIESHTLPSHNIQYPDIQKNLSQHREVHDNYPKQSDIQIQQTQKQKQKTFIENIRKKSMPTADYQDAPKSEYIPENPPKQNVNPKITYQDLKPVKRQPTENINIVTAVPQHTHLKPNEVDPQSPKFYQDAQPIHQFVKKPESKLIKKEIEPPIPSQKSYLADQKKITYEQSNKQVTTTKKIEQKQQKQKSEVSTKVHTQQKVFQENKTTIKSLSETQKKSTKLYSQASQEIIENGVYKSSAPPDTPDIVKSSLPKDDNFPILKKFGPPQRHLYTPNAYKNPLGRSDSHSDVKPSGPIMTRKFSDPTLMAKFSAPEIIETPSTPMIADAGDEIPKNIVFNNVAQFSNMSRRISETTEIHQKFPTPNNRPNPLSKSDSWNKICQQQTAAKPPSPKFNQSGEFGSHGLRRAKSGHTLALPKMYEAGIKREEISEKQKTVAAYFSGNKSPNSLSRNSSQTNLIESTAETSVLTTKRSSINRIRTSDKASINRQNPSTGLSRSATMPHILNLLDESNVEDAFEELMNS